MIDPLATNSRSICVWDDCDQEAIYCPGHAAEFMLPELRKLSDTIDRLEREPLSRVIGQLRALLTRLHPNYPEHASLAGAIKQLEGFTPPPPAVDYEAAIKLVWETIDPFRPAGQPGSYARGYYNGTIFALEQLRSNLDAARASATKRADDVDTLERRFKCAFCEKQFLTAEVRGHHQEECLGKGERDE